MGNKKRKLGSIRTRMMGMLLLVNVAIILLLSTTTYAFYEELLMVCNLYREEALPELIAILHKKLQKTESVIGFSDVKPTVKQFPTR